MLRSNLTVFRHLARGVRELNKFCEEAYGITEMSASVLKNTIVMERNLNLTISTPCHESWENFAMTSSGGFCSSCRKTVVDLTRMSDKEVLKYLQQKTSHVCARTRRDQLKTYAMPSLTTSMLFKAAAVGLFLLMISKPAVSQMTPDLSLTSDIQKVSAISSDLNAPVASVIIKGVVKAEDGEVVPGVSIVRKGTTEGTITNVDGKFEFPKALNEGDVLVFSFVGYKTIEYAVRGDEAEPIVIMLSTDSIIMGELIVEEIAVEECLTPEQTGFRGWWAKVKGMF